MQDPWQQKLYRIISECVEQITNVFTKFSHFVQGKYFANHVSSTKRKSPTQDPKIGPDSQECNVGQLSTLKFVFLE